MLVAPVLFGMDFRRIRHELAGMLQMRLREQRVVRGLGVVALGVPLGCEFMIVRSRPVMRGGLLVVFDRFVFGHQFFTFVIGMVSHSMAFQVGPPEPEVSAEFPPTFAST